MKNRFTNNDRMLQIVISNEKLIDHGKYDFADYSTIEQALSSDNVVVVTVAKIINGLRSNSSDKEMYTEISNYLKDNLL